MDPPVPGEGAVHMALPAPIRLQITFYTSMCSASEKAHMREHISGFAFTLQHRGSTCGLGNLVRPEVSAC